MHGFHTPSDAHACIQPSQYIMTVKLSQTHSLSAHHVCHSMSSLYLNTLAIQQRSTLFINDTKAVTPFG